ncbi:MAG: hypothetical protein FWC46_02380 [Actinomycetia bacterium]|nr:hypothetical protein [Actinomycetes bacterium]
MGGRQRRASAPLLLVSLLLFTGMTTLDQMKPWQSGGLPVERQGVRAPSPRAENGDKSIRESGGEIMVARTRVAAAELRCTRFCLTSGRSA